MRLGELGTQLAPAADWIVHDFTTARHLYQGCFRAFLDLATAMPLVRSCATYRDEKTRCAETSCCQ